MLTASASTETASVSVIWRAQRALAVSFTGESPFIIQADSRAITRMKKALALKGAIQQTEIYDFTRIALPPPAYVAYRGGKEASQQRRLSRG